MGDGGFESDVDCLAESSWVRSGLGASFVVFWWYSLEREESCPDDLLRCLLGLLVFPESEVEGVTDLSAKPSLMVVRGLKGTLLKMLLLDR